MTTEYARCPGYEHGNTLERSGCGSLVKILEGDRISYCCVPCFTTSWEPIQDGLWGREPKFVDYGHSDQCRDRQVVRAGLEPVTDREFSIMGAMPNERPEMPPL